MTRFFADENVSRFVVERLRAMGMDVETVGPAVLGAPDTEILGTAAHQDRILITEDRDFGELVIRQRLVVLGVILLELDRLSNAAEAERVAAVVSEIAARLPGHLVVIEPGRVRIRPLPG